MSLLCESKVHSPSKCLARVACLWSKLPKYVPEGRNERGRVATPTSFSIFDSHNMKLGATRLGSAWEISARTHHYARQIQVDNYQKVYFVYRFIIDWHDSTVQNDLSTFSLNCWKKGAFARLLTYLYSVHANFWSTKYLNISEMFSNATIHS